MGPSNGSGPITVGDEDQVRNLAVEFPQSLGNASDGGCSIRPAGTPDGKFPLGTMVVPFSPLIVLFVRKFLPGKDD
jgi:hypothetical protein